jgi:hypothetical protein
VCDLFKKWDEDKSGTIDKGEFARAIRSFGIDVPRPEVDKLFDSLDEDGSGSLEYKELNTMLRKGTGSEASLKNLRRAEKLNVKKIERGLYAARVTALPDMSSSRCRVVRASLTNSKPFSTGFRSSCWICFEIGIEMAMA